MKMIKHRKATKAKFSIGTMFSDYVVVFLLDHIHIFRTCLPQRLLIKYAEFGLAMAPHSSTLAWKIPWTEEPVGCSPSGR